MTAHLLSYPGSVEIVAVTATQVTLRPGAAVFGEYPATFAPTVYWQALGAWLPPRATRRIRGTSWGYFGIFVRRNNDPVLVRIRNSASSTATMRKTPKLLSARVITK